MHRLSGGICNFYVVQESDKVVLVDAGAAGDWGLLLTALAAMGREPGDIDAVLLTHAHSDHTGFAERARAEAGARVWIQGADAAVARGGKPPRTEGGMARYLVHGAAYHTAYSLMRRGGLRIVPIAEVSSFADGEVIDVPGRPRAVHVPGHTAGSAALLFAERSVLLTGDALVTHNPFTGRTGPQIMPAGVNQSSAEAMRSLDRLAAMPAETVLPGHGEPWKHGAGEAARLAREAGPS